mmetsp:Transcript_10299/g.31000  ORF Transcript_10299/g.31000 Transcript_10299/m.31000 type:complete len:263 (-) Transcript_10299:1606-2394(-)
MPATRASVVLRSILAVLQLAAVVVVLVWIWKYLKGFSTKPAVTGPNTNDTGQLFNWHPLCMVIAFPVLMAEALLAYRAPYTAELQKTRQKTIHVAMHLLAVAIAAGGVVAAWKSHSLKRPIPTDNLYSLHSWLGLSTLGLAAVQAGMGVVVYLVPRLAPARRAAFYQYHAALGGATFTLAITTMLAGLQEKMSFMIVFGKVPVYDAGIRLPAVLGLLLVAIALLVGAQLLPGHPQGSDGDAVQYEAVVEPVDPLDEPAERLL